MCIQAKRYPVASVNGLVFPRRIQLLCLNWGRRLGKTSWKFSGWIWPHGPVLGAQGSGPSGRSSVAECSGSASPEDTMRPPACFWSEDGESACQHVLGILCKLVSFV